MRTRGPWIVGAFAAALCTAPSWAHAESKPSLDVRHFQPPTAPDGSLYLEPAMTPGPGLWNAGGWLSWGYRPVVLRDASDKVVAKLVEHQLSLDLVAGLGIGKRAALGLAVPAVLLESGEDTAETQRVLGGSSLPSQALGDVAVTGKVTVLPYEEMGGFGLAALARVTLPTGSRTSFAGEGALTSELRLLAELNLIALAVQGTAGFKLRTEQRTFAGESWGSEIPWGAAIVLRPQALGWDDEGKWTWALEAHGALPAGPESPFTSAPLTPALFGAFARFAAFRDVSITGGVEGPLDGAVGVPLLRVLAGLAWAPRLHDMDSDGVDDDRDECPELAEDPDHFDDHDGCPDFDNDNDGAPDHEDRCPGAIEDLDDFEDEDGCPDFDNDGDGIPDEQDSCPEVAGARSTDPSTQGCPVLDKDGDGLSDGQDRCPDEAEDKDGFEDEDGCPDADNDQDGIVDAEDQCINIAGPASSNAKWNGCPIPDKDGDTFDDESDKCPAEPETWNGVDDGDGCPDRGGAWLVRVQDTQTGPTLRTRLPIRFKGAPGAPEVDDSSLSVVRAIASELNGRPDWVLAIGTRPLQADGPLGETFALSRAFSLVLSLRAYTFRDGVAETVGWDAVKDQPGAQAQGIGFLVLGRAEPATTRQPAAPPKP